MPDNPMPADDAVPDEAADAGDERAAKLDAALAESQRLERAERDADLARQVQTDEALTAALAKRPSKD